MKAGDAIRQRRSVREYTEKIPTAEQIDKIMEAGIWAPSGLNNQPWKFMVVKESEKKKGLSGFTKYKDVINNAPVCICVFLNNNKTYNRDKDIMATGACIQNMLLEAHELGLGTCWLGEILNKKEGVKKYLGVDPGHELMAVITLGYPEEGIAKGCRRILKSFILK
jgi:nitroreductase